MEGNNELLDLAARQTLYINAIKLINDAADELSKLYADNARRVEASSGFPKEILTITKRESAEEIDTLRKMIARLIRKTL